MCNQAKLGLLNLVGKYMRFHTKFVANRFCGLVGVNPGKVYPARHVRGVPTFPTYILVTYDHLIILLDMKFVGPFLSYAADDWIVGNFE